MKILILLFIFILLSCSSQNDNSVADLSKIAKDGGDWAGAPDSPNKKPYDYFYLLQKGNITSKLIKPEQREKACMDFVSKNGLVEISVRIFKMSIEQAVCEDCNENKTMGYLFAALFMNQKKEIQILECNSLVKDNLISVNSKQYECECLTYLKVVGGQKYILTKYEQLNPMERHKWFTSP